jgi:hypothetical protein
MHPQPYLYPVALSAGYAVVCERCQTTIATTWQPDDLATIIASHTCPTTGQQEVAR